VTTRQCSSIESLAVIRICRTYGAWHLIISRTQCYRTGLQSSAPPALRCNSQISPPTTNCQLEAATCLETIPNRTQQSRSAGGATQRSPARKGWDHRQKNSEHRRCDTYRSRIVVIALTLQGRGFSQFNADRSRRRSCSGQAFAQSRRRVEKSGPTPSPQLPAAAFSTLPIYTGAPHSRITTQNIR
jgi:hypothetical protein